MNRKKNVILVPLDFHEQSMIALEQTRALATFLKAEILILYVIEELDIISSLFRNREQEEIIEKEIEKKLKQLAKETSDKYKRSVSYRIEKGKVYDKVLKIAGEVSARFIVMGKNDADGGIKKYAGSNATHIIANATCPVITIKGKEHKLNLKNIVLPLDLTKQTKEKVFNAISLGLHFNSAIWMVSVLKGGISLTRSRIYAKMKKAKRIIEENGVPCTIKLFKRTEIADYEKVISYSHEIDADLIMIMTHQESDFMDHYIGKFAHEIINRSDIPVMTITPSLPKSRKKIFKTFIDPFNIFGDKG